MDLKIADSHDHFTELGAGTIYRGPIDVRGDKPHQRVWCCPPCGHAGVLSDEHVLTEDENGITVEPSIWCHGGDELYSESCWHGFLRNSYFESV